LYCLIWSRRVCIRISRRVPVPLSWSHGIPLSAIDMFLSGQHQIRRQSHALSGVKRSLRLFLPH
jgi:hypothetical protein